MELANAQFNNFFNRPGCNKYFIENFVPDEKDTNSYVMILANNIPCNSTVLDVGCAQGKFGGYLHDRKGCRMYGIEINESAIEYVKSTGKYEDIFCFNVELDESSAEFRRFDNTIAEIDCIIISDVLEHLSDPTTVLMKMGKRLKTGGRILISIPNIGHADIYLNLMNGVFNYSELGILDNTHLKFFTKRSFCQWINQINDVYTDYCFDCNYLGGTFYYSTYLWNIKQNSKALFNLIQSNPDFNVLQLLFILTKLPANSATPALDAILKEPANDLVQLIDNAVSGNMHARPLSMYAGERDWYESRVELLSEQINSLSAKNGELERQVGRLKNHHEVLQSHTDKIKECNRTLEQDINWLREKNSSLERDVCWLKEKNSSLERDMSWLGDQKSQIEQLLAVKYKELSMIHDSFSWKITSPLRWIKKLFR